jgi:hypothetical protein
MIATVPLVNAVVADLALVQPRRSLDVIAPE